MSTPLHNSEYWTISSHIMKNYDVIVVPINKITRLNYSSVKKNIVYSPPAGVN